MICNVEAMLTLHNRNFESFTCLHTICTIGSHPVCQFSLQLPAAFSFYFSLISNPFTSLGLSSEPLLLTYSCLPFFYYSLPTNLVLFISYSPHTFLQSLTLLPSFPYHSSFHCFADYCVVLLLLLMKLEAVAEFHIAVFVLPVATNTLLSYFHLTSIHYFLSLL